MADHFEYTKMCYNESLRLEPPVPVSGFQIMTKDVQLGETLLKANQPFYIGTELIQRDPRQFEDPLEYIPERFDSKSKYFRRPDGGARHPLAFSPFLGGKRTCIAKSLVEMMTRYTIPLIFYHFDFEFTNPE